ncbi:MAG: OmpH family outer membrane protein [Bacteroidetes bacterium]|nr:OmpH family outer membrane protein [Bacteroidota bacterium]
MLAVSFLVGTTTQAQKFAYVDTDYILNKIPEFKQAQDKLDDFSADWQKEIEGKYADVEQMYRAYQQEQVLLTDEMKTKREEAIIAKENAAKNLQQKYFGPTGDLYTKRQELIKPIQDKIQNAIQQLAANNKYQIIFDSSSDLILLYKDNNLDQSDKVLELMGY